MVHDGLALRAVHLVDPLVLVVGVVVEVRGRDFLEDAAGIGPEAVPDTWLHETGLAGLKRAHMAFYADVQHAVENLKKVIARIENVTPEAIRFGLQPIFEESQRLVPVDTSRLKSSGFIETRQRVGGVSAEIGYGRFGIPHYAGFVHEMIDIPHAPPTRAKYLEAAVNLHIGDFGRRVGLYMEREVGLR